MNTRKINNYIYDVSILILIFLSICLCSTKILFLMGGNVSSNLFTVYLIAAIIIFFLVGKGKNQIRIKIFEILVFLLIVIGAIIINTYIFDISYDGSAYHEMAIGLLAHGWNPVKMTAEEFVTVNGMQLMGKLHGIWINHYGSATWTIASVIYAFTGFIESGKALNLLSMISLFGISVRYISRWKSYKIFNYIISLFLAVNPLTLGQLFTNYVDGVLMIYLELGVLAWFVIVKENENNEKIKGLALLFCSIIFCSNIKFTGLFYVGMYTIIFYLIILFKAYRQKRLKNIFIKLTSILAFMVIISVCVIGYSPYISNTIHNGHPLYPLMGEGKVDILTDQQPKSFQNKNNLEKLFVSLFSRVDNINVSVDREPELKIPFSVNAEEIHSLSVDTRISGFGPWFSGILIVSCILLIIYYGKKIYNKKSVDVYFTAVLILSILLTLGFTESWWARYSIYEYFIVLSVLFIMEFSKGKWKKNFINIAVCLMFVINNVFWCIGYQSLFSYSRDIHGAINDVAALSKNVTLEMNLIADDLSGAQFNLHDYGIDFTISEEDFSAGGIYCGYTYRIKE